MQQELIWSSIDWLNRWFFFTYFYNLHSAHNLPSFPCDLWVHNTCMQNVGSHLFLQEPYGSIWHHEMDRWAMLWGPVQRWHLWPYFEPVVFFGSFSSTVLYCTECLQYQTMLRMLWTVFGKRLCPLVRQEAWRRQAFLAWWTIVHRQGRIWELEDMQSCPIKRDLSTISIRTYRIQGMTSQSSLFVLD